MSQKQIHSNLQTLQSFHIPPPPKPSTTTLAQYTLARDKFLHQRIKEVFHEYVSTFDGKHFDVPETECNSSSFQDKEAEVLERIEDVSQKVTEKINKVNVLYGVFEERRRELERLVQDMDEDEDDAVGSDGDESCGEEMDEKTLTALIEQKVALESQLKKVEMECEILGVETDAMTKQLHEQETNLSESFHDNHTQMLEIVNDEIQEYKRKIEKCREMEIWYDNVIEAIEVVGGVKILEVVGDGDDGLVITIGLMERYELEVTLSDPLRSCDRKRSHKSSSSTSHLIISHAHITSPSTITSKHSPTTVTTPPPTISDLVSISRPLPSVQNVQFLVRETLSRLRGIEIRLEELARLREAYLTKITDTEEIICSLDDGVTVVIRLTPDCPLLPGSVYIEKIVGVGGWEEDELERVKDIVNGEGCVGAVEVMDALVREINAREKPATPSLPMRKNKDGEQ